MRHITIILLYSFSLAASLSAQVLLIDRVDLNEEGRVSIGFEANASSYYVLTRSQDLTSFEQVLSIQLGSDGPFELSDMGGGLIGGRGFYRITQAEIANPIDLDNDGIDDLTEINSGGKFDPLNPLDGLEDSDSDGANNSKELADGTDPFVSDLPPLTSVAGISPTLGEQLVSPNRQVRISFDGPINPASVTPFNVFLLINENPIPSSASVSTTGKVVTITPIDPLPAATLIQVGILPDTISDIQGTLVDMDLDGNAGGAFGYFFQTLSLDRIENTNIFGFVKDSYSEIPIQGATIRVDGLPAANVVTDENGRFELVNLPAPEFFVHIDGGTATNAPDGKVYPVVGKQFHSSPGQTVRLNQGGWSLIFSYHLWMPEILLNFPIRNQPRSDSEMLAKANSRISFPRSPPRPGTCCRLLSLQDQRKIGMEFPLLKRVLFRFLPTGPRLQFLEEWMLLW
ncbi:MAG: Ig-like domain-containing protein [Verrucomicrobia bacterium]|nr:Ig-like domain-containing protein [Verrucomicrobiota bacterium]MDA1068321.1 Ig-like domain-containing protein [Verrucomicrobiota bacterium]